MMRWTLRCILARVSFSRFLLRFADKMFDKLKNSALCMFNSITLDNSVCIDNRKWNMARCTEHTVFCNIMTYFEVWIEEEVWEESCGGEKNFLENKFPLTKRLSNSVGLTRTNTSKSKFMRELTRNRSIISKRKSSFYSTAKQNESVKHFFTF